MDDASDRPGPMLMVTRGYFAALAMWAAGHFGVSDERLAPLFLLNAVAPWLFIPAIAATALAVGRGRRTLGAACFLTGVLATWLFVGWFLPKPSGRAPNGPTLTAMTYNVAAGNRHPAAVVAAIRAGGADLVGLFELQPDVAALLREALQSEYPYQLLVPDAGVHGMGALSRFPLRPLPERLAGAWSGLPQVLGVDWHAEDVVWINAHAHSPGVAIAAWQNHRSVADAWAWLTVRRQEETQAIRDFALRHRQPMVITTDLNTTPYNAAYATATDSLTDAWREAGWGWGHTWSLFRRRLGVPFWVARIDYVFCSGDWMVQRTSVGPWDGISDHRPVVATLALRDRPHL